jgi:hypothetical protein
MKYWKIHLAWAMLTLILAGLWGRWTVRSREPEVQERERAIQAGETNQSLPLVAPAHPPGPSNPAEMTGPGLPSPSGAPGLSDEEEYVNSIRRLFRSDRREDWQEAGRRLNRIPNGDVKIELCREELSCRGAGFRYSAIYKLHDLLGADEVPILKNVLRTEPEAYIRRLSAQLLGLHGDPGTLDALLEAYRDPDPTVQVTAAASLNRLGQPGPAEELLPKLASSLRDPDGAVRREAVGDIRRLRLLSSAPLILQSFRDSNGDVRWDAARGLVDLDPPGLLSTLEDLRKDPDPNVVEAAEAGIQMYDRAHKPK